MKEILESLEKIITMLTNFKAQNRWLSPEDLEREYGLKESTISKYRMRREIPYSKIGAKIIRYDRKKIDEWLENNEMVVQNEQ